MPKKNLGKTGSAQIEKQGQTADGHYGLDPDVQGKFKGKRRDLTVK